jgi:teichoic acid transport system permease protein
MSGSGRISGPGSLSGPGTLSGATPPAGGVTALPAGPLNELAAEHGLRPSARRPPLRAYIRQIWQRRHFILTFATARNVAMYTDARLGQLWQVLTPLLNAAVYFLIFGVLLGTSRGVPNFLAFLVTGVFIFTFTQRSFLIASRVVNDHLSLIRALRFPRACLPLAYVVVELQQLLLSMLVLFAIVLISGEPVTWYWLLIIPALALQAVFNVGGGMIIARVGAGVADFSQLLPFLLRTWMYLSGVIFSLRTLPRLSGHHTLQAVLQANPAAVYIDLVRNALLQSQRLSNPGAMPYNYAKCMWYGRHPTAQPYWSAYCHPPPLGSSADLWMLGAGWAVAALVIGFLFFWHAEAVYGRG